MLNEPNMHRRTEDQVGLINLLKHLVFLIFSQVNKSLVEKNRLILDTVLKKEVFSNRTVMRINKSDGLPIMFGH